MNAPAYNVTVKKGDQLWLQSALVSESVNRWLERLIEVGTMFMDAETPHRFWTDDHNPKEICTVQLLWP